MANWNIDSAHGNSITEGIQTEAEARRIAQEYANELGESVYLYQPGDDDDTEEIVPPPPTPADVVLSEAILDDGCD